MYAFRFPAHDNDRDDFDEGDKEQPAAEAERRRSAEYDRAYNAELDCDILFASCATIFLINLRFTFISSYLYSTAFSPAFKFNVCALLFVYTFFSIYPAHSTTRRR